MTNSPVTELQVWTRRFGPPEQVVVSPSNLYSFPEAVPGLPDSHRYALITDDAYGPLHWLQSLDDEAVCLPVLAAEALALPGYLAAVSESAGAGARILLVTRFDEEAGTFAVNLLAPVLLDERNGTGRQVILDGQSHPIRQHIVWDSATQVFVPC